MYILAFDIIIVGMKKGVSQKAKNLTRAISLTVAGATVALALAAVLFFRDWKWGLIALAVGVAFAIATVVCFLMYKAEREKDFNAPRPVDRAETAQTIYSSAKSEESPERQRAEYVKSDYKRVEYTKSDFSGSESPRDEGEVPARPRVEYTKSDFKRVEYVRSDFQRDGEEGERLENASDEHLNSADGANSQDERLDGAEEEHVDGESDKGGAVDNADKNYSTLECKPPKFFATVEQVETWQKARADGDGQGENK